MIRLIDELLHEFQPYDVSNAEASVVQLAPRRMIEIIEMHREWIGNPLAPAQCGPNGILGMAAHLRRSISALSEGGHSARPNAEMVIGSPVCGMGN